jgi:hypothetical protein
MGREIVLTWRHGIVAALLSLAVSSQANAITLSCTYHSADGKTVNDIINTEDSTNWVTTSGSYTHSYDHKDGIVTVQTINRYTGEATSQAFKALPDGSRKLLVSDSGMCSDVTNKRKLGE